MTAVSEDKNNPLCAISDFYNAGVEEKDKAGYAQRLKEATEVFFKDVNGIFSLFHDNPVHFTDVEYLDGYFVFGRGTNTVIHFHVDECPGWLFAIWWDIPDNSEELADTIHGQFFTQYEETIDKFKPSRSVICYDIVARFSGVHKSCDCYKAHDVIKFIQTEPALAFCRDYCGWDYNAEYHTKEEAEQQFTEYKVFAANEAKYTKICNEKVMNFVREKVLPQFNDAEICIDEGWSPEYHIVAPYESNKDIVEEPGMYDFFDDDEDGKALAAEFASIKKECDAIADKYGFMWSSPIGNSVLIYNEDEDSDD